MDEWDSDYRYEPCPLFQEIFRCIPFRKYKKPHLERGDKIILPPSSLSQLLSLPIKYPLLFKIETYNSEKTSHCGVLEFDAEEGFVHMPDWMMKNLNLREGEDVIVTNAAALSKAAYMKLQPHAAAFAELADPKAVLENTLRDFTCLSRGDTIRVEHNFRDFYFDVVEVMPGDAVTLIETDCEVEFAPPLDYVEERDDDQATMVDEGDCCVKVDNDDDRGGEKELKGEVKCLLRPFTGKARRLDGEAVVAVVEELSKAVVVEEGKKSGRDGGKIKEGFKPFTGWSCVLGGACFP